MATDQAVATKSGSAKRGWLVAAAVGHEPNASKAEEHQDPGGGLGNGNREEGVGDHLVGCGGRMNAVPIRTGITVRANDGPTGIGDVGKTIGTWIEYDRRAQADVVIVVRGLRA